MKLGISYCGITGHNGADFVADFLRNAAVADGVDVTMIGGWGQAQARDIPAGLDVVIHSSGYELTPELVEKWKRTGAKVFVWSHNDEVPLFRDRLQRITFLVDRHFSYTRVPYYGSHVEFLPLGADHTIYTPIEPCKKIYDVAMIGAWHTWRREFAGKLAPHFPKNQFNLTMNLSHHDVNLLYNQTRVVVAPMQHCDQDGDHGKDAVYGCPCRTFDVPASGAFQLQAFRQGLLDVHSSATLGRVTLPIIRDVDVSIPLWIAAIQAWLSNESERLALADAMRQDILREHLYVHRLRKMLAFV